MFAHRSEKTGRFYPVGSRAYVEAHVFRQPILSVLVAEVPDDDETATHWGWMRHASAHYQADMEPHMIWGSHAQFEVCFPYGSQAEVDRGKGRVLRLRTVLAATLSAAAHDLDGFIERRAQEIAGPLVAKAKEAAQEHVDDARFEEQRQRDLAAELKRRIGPLDRTRDKYLALREVAQRVLRTYDAFLTSDDVRDLHAALTDLQEAAR